VCDHFVARSGRDPCLFCVLLYLTCATATGLGVAQGVACFFVLFLAVVMLFAGLFRLYGQTKNFMGASSPARSLTPFDSFFLSLGNLSPTGSCIQPKSTPSRTLVSAQWVMFVFGITAFGALFLAKQPKSGVPT
jgi:hypothetical protein